MHHKPFGGAYNAAPDSPAGLKGWAPGKGRVEGRGTGRREEGRGNG